MSRRPKAVVSYNMSRIRATGSKIESVILAEIRKAGLKGCRKHPNNVFGKPDFCWKKDKIAVFCDSDFWHGYKWGTEFRNSFKIRKKFWVNKIKSNILRDEKVNKELSKEGWKVLRFWEHDIINNPEKCVLKIKKYVNSK
jgi:DNA mismatch endonuclease Vsr